jgi:hypothetical protein
MVLCSAGSCGRSVGGPFGPGAVSVWVQQPLFLSNLESRWVLSLLLVQQLPWPRPDLLPAADQLGRALQFLLFKLELL